jgi:hypothetical protein
MSGHDKIECSSEAGLSSLVECFWVRPGAYPIVEHPEGVSLGLTPALFANIRLGWRGLPMTNAVAYCNHL